MANKRVKRFLGDPQPGEIAFILGRNPLWPNQKPGEPIVVPYDEEGVRTLVQQGLGPDAPFGTTDPSDLMISMTDIDKNPDVLEKLLQEKDVIIPVGGKPAFTANPFGDPRSKKGLFHLLGIAPPFGFYQMPGPLDVIRSHPLRGYIAPKPRHVLALQEAGLAYPSEVGPTGALTTDHTAFYGHNLKRGDRGVYLLFITPGHGSGQAMLPALDWVVEAQGLAPGADFLAVVEFAAAVDRGRERYAPTHIRFPLPPKE